MKLDKKRRLKYKTDYRNRIVLLKSKIPRLVIRKTNNYLILQLIESTNAQDKVTYSVNTKELLKHGWPEAKKGSLKSLPAAYLAGLLLGKKAKTIKKAVLDTGLIHSTKGSRIYAAVKGFSDSGIEINYSDEVIPSKERLEGKNTKVEDVFNKIKGAIK
ncbi:MAG: 50S ribosomal protein L18 [Nanoarchaeota archaeon]|nr:50S ribosomal protein L18 [Nanoarchaeota archaeon]